MSALVGLIVIVAVVAWLLSAFFIYDQTYVGLPAPKICHWIFWSPSLVIIAIGLYDMSSDLGGLILRRFEQ